MTTRFYLHEIKWLDFLNNYAINICESNLKELTYLFLIMHGLLSTIKSIKSFFIHAPNSISIASSCKYLPPRSSLHDPRKKLMVVAIHKTTLKYLHSLSHLCSECQLPHFNLATPFLRKNPCVSGLVRWVNNACVDISM